GINRNINKSDQRNRISQRETVKFLGHKPHDRRKNGAADDGHDQQRTADFRVRTKTLEAQSKNCRKHQRHKKAGEKNAPKPKPAGMEYADRNENNICEAVSA